MMQKLSHGHLRQSPVQVRQCKCQKNSKKNYNASIRILSFESINLLAKTLQLLTSMPSLNQFSLIGFHTENYFIKNTDNPHLPEKIENALAEKKTKVTA
jgi:hypothetical protein